MGRGIAALCALRGYSTAVYEADPAIREGLRGAIEESWQRAVARGKLSAESLGPAARRLSVAENIAEASASAFAIEAIPELLDAKRRLFHELDASCPPTALLASNTSSLSIARIAEGLRHPERVVGIHFFNPVATMPLVEIVRAPSTSADAAERAAAFAESLGKQTVRVRDSPGFATSRLGVALGLEAIRMVEEGVAEPADIDRAMELGYGHRMGPLKTTDLVGLDVRLAIAQSLAAELDDRRFDPPALLRRMVARGETGKKSGRGFYEWEGDTARALPPHSGAPEGRG